MEIRSIDYRKRWLRTNLTQFDTRAIIINVLISAAHHFYLNYCQHSKRHYLLKCPYGQINMTGNNKINVSSKQKFYSFEIFMLLYRHTLKDIARIHRECVPQNTSLAASSKLQRNDTEQNSNYRVKHLTEMLFANTLPYCNISVRKTYKTSIIH